MTWLITAKQYIPTVIGEAFGGGYFAGYISHTADGNPTHALIVAPAATGATGSSYTLTTNLAWALNQNAANGTNYSTTTIGTVTNGSFDGTANMAVFNTIGISNFPAAEFCENLTIGGFTDWYLPSRYELEIAYFNLKPSTAANDTRYGINAYSVPARSVNYTSTYPARTQLTSFSTGAQAFVAGGHWASDQVSASTARIINLNDGDASNINNGKTLLTRVRAFRRIAL